MLFKVILTNNSYPLQVEVIISIPFTRAVCKTLLFAQFWCQAQILILKILNVLLWLKFSPSLNLNKNEHFSKVSTQDRKSSGRLHYLQKFLPN